jgi:dihydroorotate dehydrogenase
MIPYALIRPLLFTLDAERAHEMTLGLLAVAGSLGLAPRPPARNNPVEVMGLEFPNRIGLAAGLDKNGDRGRWPRPSSDSASSKSAP